MLYKIFTVTNFIVFITFWDVPRKEGGRTVIKMLAGKPLRKSRQRREDNIRMDLKDIGVTTRNWTGIIRQIL